MNKALLVTEYVLLYELYTVLYVASNNIICVDNYYLHIPVSIRTYEKKEITSMDLNNSACYIIFLDMKANIVLTNNFSFFHSQYLLIFLAACNRTLYGETGKTYELEIRKPKVFPFVCHLNFTAPGGLYGDIIQVRNLYYGLYCERGKYAFLGYLRRMWLKGGWTTVLVLCYMMLLYLSVEKVWVGQHKKDNSFLLIFVGSVVFSIKPGTDIKLKIIIINTIIADII